MCTFENIAYADSFSILRDPAEISIQFSTSRAFFDTRETVEWFSSVFFRLLLLLFFCFLRGDWGTFTDLENDHKWPYDIAKF